MPKHSCARSTVTRVVCIGWSAHLRVVTCGGVRAWRRGGRRSELVWAHAARFRTRSGLSPPTVCKRNSALRSLSIRLVRGGCCWTLPGAVSSAVRRFGRRGGFSDAVWATSRRVAAVGVELRLHREALGRSSSLKVASLPRQDHRLRALGDGRGRVAIVS